MNLPRHIMRPRTEGTKVNPEAHRQQHQVYLGFVGANQITPDMQHVAYYSEKGHPPQFIAGASTLQGMVEAANTKLGVPHKPYLFMNLQGHRESPQ